VNVAATVSFARQKKWPSIRVIGSSDAKAWRDHRLDGLFLHSSSLAGCFDFTIFVSAPYETCLARARARNQERASDLDELEAVYRERYIPGFRRSCVESKPQVRASAVVET
jgi:pantothenate kinase